MNMNKLPNTPPCSMMTIVCTLNVQLVKFQTLKLQQRWQHVVLTQPHMNWTILDSITLCKGFYFSGHKRDLCINSS